MTDPRLGQLILPYTYQSNVFLLDIPFKLKKEKKQKQISLVTA